MSLKFFVLLIFKDIKQRKATHLHIWEAGTMTWLIISAYTCWIALYSISTSVKRVWVRHYPASSEILKCMDCLLLHCELFWQSLILYSTSVWVSADLGCLVIAWRLWVYRWLALRQTFRERRSSIWCQFCQVQREKQANWSRVIEQNQPGRRW